MGTPGKYRDRLLKAAMRMVESNRNRSAADLVVGSLDFLEEADAIFSEVSDAEDRQEQCICAAIRLRNGEVWRGHRHDLAMQAAARAPDTNINDVKSGVQGFITSRNRFVTREQGAKIQRRAGIVSAQTQQPVGDLLFSEDLYLRDWRSR